MKINSQKLKRFKNAEHGLAALEFAIIAPLLVLFLLGTTTATQSIWANGKVNQTASVIGDLISQETELTDITFNQLMNAAPILVEPFPQADLKMTVTAAIACNQSKNTNGKPDIKYFVIWSKSWTAGNLGPGPQRPGEPMAQPPADLLIPDGDYLIKTLSEYTHTPTIGRKVGATIEMGEVAYHQPRESDPVSYPTEESPSYQTCADMP